MRLTFALALLLFTAEAAAQDAAERIYAQKCAGCHGENATGGDRAPALKNSRSLRNQSDGRIHDLIQKGRGAMPAFALPEEELLGLAKWLRSFNASAFEAPAAGDQVAGERFFFGKGQCSTCHMVSGRGQANGPDLSDIGRQSTVAEIESVLDHPGRQTGTRSTASCPPWAFCADESWNVVNVRMRNGSTLRGYARNQGRNDLQLHTFDGRLLLLTTADYVNVTREKASHMPALKASSEERRDLLAYVSRLGGGETPGGAPETISAQAIEAVMRPKRGEWPTYNGVPGGNRHSPLDGINAGNVGTLQLQWVYPLRSLDLEVTPLVSEGVMYVAAPNRVCALDARTGREIWCYTRPADEVGPYGPQPKRGVALLGDRIFFATDNARLVCLHRLTGGVMWDIDMVDGPGRFYATSAPLVVGNLVISGVAGGDGPMRGYLNAYDASTGKQVWRFWSIPKTGEPGSETWKGQALASGGGATWLTGSYDVETGTLYWAIGNPFPATDGDGREGVNLYSNCVVALDAKTGKLRWFYQFTPHDLHDWDATEPFVLVDAAYQGRDRKLLLQANRNGFFYVLDRVTGELLLAKPFVKKLNWARGIGADGKPQLLPANRPSRSGTTTCPAVRGATNWYSTSFHPASKLFYVMAVEDCSVYRQSQNGGYEGYAGPSDPARKVLRALNIETGATAWEIEQPGSPESNYSGVLSTAGGLLFYGETGGDFAAVDAFTGRALWTFPGNAVWRASAMTYLLDGRQFVAVASGANVLSFALPGGK